MNRLLKAVDIDNEIRHPFVVDITFNVEDGNPKTLMYNELCTTIFEKQKMLHVSGPFVFQLSENTRMGGKK